ncbi:MAG: DNA polymerase IV [Lachnospiraceae bacterium]|nr:DNA polymerase IV [Lachnospiraceae bacterium]
MKLRERTILHSDMNCFYASVEMMLDPSLRGKAVAVCGSTENRHGIVLAKSELAKKAGVKTGMVNWEARQLCPNLIMVKPQYDQYLKYSELARNIYQRYTDQVEPYGMDECWLDVTGSRSVCGDGAKIAENIRQTVKEELGLTVSIGVSFNKIFAKLGSDMKKPDAITEITRESFRDKVWPLPASDLLYVGRATTAKFNNYGIHTIGDIAAADPNLLKRMLGVNGLQLWQYAAGKDDTPVMHKDFVSPIKSVGHGITCIADLLNEEEVWKVMLELSQDIGHRLRLHKLKATGVQISVRSNDLGYRQFQGPLSLSTQSPMLMAKKALTLFHDNYRWSTPVRAVTVRAINLIPQESPEQIDLFTDMRRMEKVEKLDDCIEEIRRRFGKRAVFQACLLGDLKMPIDNRHMVQMPGVMGR